MAHRIHVWYIYLLIYHKNSPFMYIGKYTVRPMDPTVDGWNPKQPPFGCMWNPINHRISTTVPSTGEFAGFQPSTVSSNIPIIYRDLPYQHNIYQSWILWGWRCWHSLPLPFTNKVSDHSRQLDSVWAWRKGRVTGTGPPKTQRLVFPWKQWGLPGNPEIPIGNPSFFKVHVSFRGCIDILDLPKKAGCNRHHLGLFLRRHFGSWNTRLNF